MMNSNLNENLNAGEELDNSPEQLGLLDSIENLMAEGNMNQKLRDMDMQVAETLEMTEYQAYLGF